MVNPYDYPHDCEKEAVTLALTRLDRQQRRVLRAYVRHVEYGDKSLTDWIKDGPNSVALSTWRKPGSRGGKYWGTEEDPVKAFRDTAKLYGDALAGWETEEEAKILRRASRQLRQAAEKAVERLIDLMDAADKDAVRLRAAESILDRAFIETATKSSQTANVIGDVRSVSVYIPDNGRG